MKVTFDGYVLVFQGEYMKFDDMGRTCSTGLGELKRRQHFAG
jgi:hypothetical protein